MKRIVIRIYYIKDIHIIYGELICSCHVYSFVNFRVKHEKNYDSFSLYLKYEWIVQYRELIFMSRKGMLVSRVDRNYSSDLIITAAINGYICI